MISIKRSLGRGELEDCKFLKLVTLEVYCKKNE
jgi:hypothetical protein